MKIKCAVLTQFLFCSSCLLQAQNFSDTIVVKHPDVAFHKYDSLSEILLVTNSEFNASTKKWSLVVDIYGESQNLKWCTETWMEIYKNHIQYKMSPYVKQIMNGLWTKGDSVKNGYWEQWTAAFSVKTCEGYMVDGLREKQWIEYTAGIKKAEGDYMHGVKEGIWHEWRSYVYEKIGEYKNGTKQGEWIEYEYLSHATEKHVVCAKMFYVNDTLEGHYKSWGWEHHPLEEGDYVHGLRDGKWVEFYRGDTLQVCYWGKGVPVRVIIFVQVRDYSHKKPVPYEVKLVKWGFDDNQRVGGWVFESPVIEEDGYHQWWEARYLNYGHSTYHFLGLHTTH